MSNALAVYSDIDNTLKFTREYSTAVAAMTGCSLAQAPGLALTALCEGKTLAEFAEENHFVEGKKSMKSQAMLAKFRRQAGGTHDVIERSENRSAIKLIDKDGKEYVGEFTLMEALASRWPWRKWRESVPKVLAAYREGKQPQQVAIEMMGELKDSWGTPTDQKTMMFHRVVSDSMRAFKPELIVDIYTPEEIEDLRVVESVVVTNQPKRPTAAEVMSAVVTTNRADAAGESHIAPSPVVGPGQPADVVIDVTPANVTVEYETQNVGPQSNGYATRSQLERLLDLRSQMNLTDVEWNAAMSARNVQAAHSLTKEQAAELIGKMESRIKAATALKN